MLIITCFTIFILQKFSEILCSSSHYPLLRSFPVVLSCDAIALSDKCFSSRCKSGNFAKVHDLWSKDFEGYVT